MIIVIWILGFPPVNIGGQVFGYCFLCLARLAEQSEAGILQFNWKLVIAN